MNGKSAALKVFIVISALILTGIFFSCPFTSSRDKDDDKPKPHNPPSSSSSNSSALSSNSGSSSSSAVTPLTVTIEQDSEQPDPTNGATVNFTVTFSEEVADFATGDISFTGSTAGGSLAGAVTGSGTTYNVAVTGMTTDGAITASINAGSAHNAANTPNNASTGIDNTIVWDITPPGVSLTCAAAEMVSDPFDISIKFTEAIDPSTFGAEDIIFTSGTGSTSSPVTSDNITWTSTITPSSTPNSNVTLTINEDAVKDRAGNNSTGAVLSITKNWVPKPKVTITSATQNRTGANPVTVTITFDQTLDFESFVSSDITVVNGTAGTPAPITGDFKTWTCDITPASVWPGSVDMAVSINAGCVQNELGVTNAASNTLNRVCITKVGYDNTSSASYLNTNTGTLNNFTVSDHENRALIVIVHSYLNTDDLDFTDTVTYGGIEMSKITQFEGRYIVFYKQTMSTKAYYLNNPPIGSHDIVVNSTQSWNIFKIYAISLYDTSVHTGTFSLCWIGDVLRNNCWTQYLRNDPTQPCPLTTTKSNSLILDITGSDNASSVNAVYPYQNVIINDPTTISLASSLIYTQEAGLINANWTYENMPNWYYYIMMLEIFIAR